MGTSGSLCSHRNNNIHDDGQYTANVNTEALAQKTPTLPAKYRVVLHPGLSCPNLNCNDNLQYTLYTHHDMITGGLCRKEKDITSKTVGRVQVDTLVTVTEIDGRRVRISEPIQGWMSLYARDGRVIMRHVKAVDDMTQQIHIQNGDKVFALKNVELDTTTLDTLRHRIQHERKTPIDNQLLFATDTGYMFTDDDMKRTLTELAIRRSLRLEVAPRFTAFDEMIRRGDIRLYDDKMRDFRNRGHLGKQYDIMHWYQILKNRQRNKTVFGSILSTMKNQETKNLFHGTSFEAIEKIVANGFDRDFNIRSRFGKGTYFAANAQLAARYSKPNANGYIALLVCQVIVGEYTVGSQDMTQSALCKSGTVDQYDTLVDNMQKPHIYVVRRDYHAIPKKIIVLRRNSTLK